MVALSLLDGIDLMYVRISRISGTSFNSVDKTEYVGCTRQAVKLAIAISDTSYPAINDAIKNIPEFLQSCGNYEKFHSLVSTESSENPDPIGTANSLLGR